MGGGGGKDKKEDTPVKRKSMIDDIIFLLSLHLIALFAINYFNVHSFAAESVIAILNALCLMYFYVVKSE